MIKGGFSFRAKRTFHWTSEIWQAGFSDHGIRDCEDWHRHVTYIEHNPVRKSLCVRSADYPYLAMDLDGVPQRLKPLSLSDDHVRAEARTLHPELRALHPEAPALHPEATALYLEAIVIKKQNDAT